MNYFSVHIKEGNIIQERQEGIIFRVNIFNCFEMFISGNLIFSMPDESIKFLFEQEKKRV